MTKFLLLFLAIAVTARAAFVVNVVAVTKPEDTTALVQSFWSRVSDTVEITLVLAPGAVGFGKYNGCSVRTTKHPIVATNLEKEYWKGEAQRFWFETRTIRTQIKATDLPNTYVALTFIPSKKQRFDSVVYCIPLVVLEQAWRAAGPKVEMPHQPEHTLPPPRPEAIAPVISPPAVPGR